MNYGRYKIEREIGKGSMGVVYRAHDPNLDLAVALKVLRHDRVVSDSFVRRFLVEARALGRLDNPHIVRVYNVDEDGGTVYIAMEFVEGQSLDEELRTKRYLTEEIVELGATVAETLDYAHGRGIVHRDIKPSNILLRSDGRLKITDFGIARVEDHSTAAFTQAGEILGTPAYMSPEQVLGKPVDGRSDLFSLGIILYELSTGSRPFKGENLAAIFHAITADEPPAPGKMNPAVSAELSRVIMKCLRKSPAERYATGKDLAGALRDCLKKEGPREKGKTVVPTFLKRNMAYLLLGTVLAAGSLGGLAYYVFTAAKKEFSEAPAKTVPPVSRPQEEPENESTIDVKSTPKGPEIVTDKKPKEEKPTTREPKTEKRQDRPTGKQEKKGAEQKKSGPAESEVVADKRPEEKSPAERTASIEKTEVQSVDPGAVKNGRGRVVRGVVAEGACAIAGMSAEQSQLIALQRARAASIEKAAGIRVASATLVRDGSAAADLIGTYFRGFVVRENVERLPVTQIQDAPEKPSIPEYRVRIHADVAVPERKSRPVGLSAQLNSKVFRKGEKARLEIVTEKESLVAVFNLGADDRLAMLYPNPYEKRIVMSAGKSMRLPREGSRVSMIMQPIAGHPRDTEAFFVIAVAVGEAVDFLASFGGGQPLSFTDFFERYAGIAPRAEEVVLPYIVEGNE